MKDNSHTHQEHGEHHDHSHSHEERTGWVVLLSAFVMAVEIYYGYRTNSMALLADGWHMASHVLALGLTWIAYVIARKYASSQQYSFDQKKLFSLSGFTSALALLCVAVYMAIEAIERFRHPLEIHFEDALLVAVIGLIVNGLSALFLHDKHEHHDHNIRSAYLHVLADLLTSIAAIVSLLAGMYYQLYSLDSISGILSAIVISKWSFGLIKNSGKDLIHFKKTQYPEV